MRQRDVDACVVARDSNFLASVCQTAKLGITINIFCHALQSVTHVDGNLINASDNASWGDLLV